MIRFATITPTRGDRPELLKFCKEQLKRMNTKPERSYFIDEPPTSDKPDLVIRIKKGIELAQRDGLDLVFIIEDDDFYPKNYFDDIQSTARFIGAPYTYYFNLKNRTYQSWSHEHRSSLFRTGFRISALKGFRWPPDTHIFLDIDLWKFAYANYSLSDKIQWRSDGAIGIKHGIGFTGGKGHRLTMKYQDPKLEWLRQRIDNDAFNFYYRLKCELQ